MPSPQQCKMWCIGIPYQESFNMLAASRTWASCLLQFPSYLLASFLHTPTIAVPQVISPKFAPKDLPVSMPSMQQSLLHQLIDRQLCNWGQAMYIHSVMCQNILVMGSKVAYKKCTFLDEGTCALTKSKNTKKTLL